MSNNIDNTVAQNETANTPTEWSYISDWMKADIATDWIQSLITEGSYKKGQIKKGSPRFANKKDKSDGYEVRVIAVSGIHPELEKSVVGYRKEIEKKVKLDTSMVHAWKQLLKIENIARDEKGQLRISDKSVFLADGRRIQIFNPRG